MADADAPGRDLDQVEQYLLSGTPEEPVFEAGDAGRGLHVIQEGRIELVAPVDGGEVTVARLGPGDFFGERSLFDDGPSEVTARAVTDYKIVVLDRRAFEQVVAEDPAIGMSLIGWLARQLEVQRAELARALRTTGAGPAGAEHAAAAAGEAAPGGPGAGEEPGADDDAGAQATAPAEGAAGARLRHPGSGSEFAIPDAPAHAEGAMIGRPDPDTGVVPDLDFSAIDERRTLSRRHARIARKDDGYWLVDQGAANGTFVNGERIAADTAVKLHDGDDIRFGLVDTVFELD